MDIFLRAATKAAATWRVAAFFTGPLLAVAAVVGVAVAVLAVAVLAVAVLPVVVFVFVGVVAARALLVSIVCATSAAFFFFVGIVGISAFRSLDTAVLATAVGLELLAAFGLLTSLGPLAGLGLVFAAGLAARDLAATIGRRATVGAAATFAVLGVAALVAFAEPLFVALFAAELFELAPKLTDGFDLAGAAPALMEDRDSGFTVDLPLVEVFCAGAFSAVFLVPADFTAVGLDTGDLDTGDLDTGDLDAGVLDAVDFVAGGLAAFVDTVGFTAVRALALGLDEVLPDVPPRKAALAFGGMENHS